MRPITTVLTATMLTLSFPLYAHAGKGDITKVIGEIRVPTNEQAGNVSTVNGSIRIGNGATVNDASTVNGSIELGDKANASSVRIVDGAVTLNHGSRVAGAVTAVNGRLFVGPGADVGGKLSNIEGSIELDAAHVAGGIASVASNIIIGANSHVEGGILLEKRSPHINGETWGVALIGMPDVRSGDPQAIKIARAGSVSGNASANVTGKPASPNERTMPIARPGDTQFISIDRERRVGGDVTRASRTSANAPANVEVEPVSQTYVEQARGVKGYSNVEVVDMGLHDGPDSMDGNGDRKPKIVIGPHAVVQGTLDFRREVTLKVSDSATIGPVKGAIAERFSGTSPWR